jgi:hypothetical protein
MGSADDKFDAGDDRLQRARLVAIRRMASRQGRQYHGVVVKRA